MREISMNSMEEFIRDVAYDCVDNMSDKNKNSIIDNPYTFDYHFGYALYIRNKYIHRRDLSGLGWNTEADYISSRIMKYIFSILIPNEYRFGDEYLERVYNHKQFIILRREYKAIYGCYPIEIVEKHRSTADVTFSEALHKMINGDANDEEIDRAIKEYEEKSRVITDLVDALVRVLAEIVWNTDKIIDEAKKYKLDINAFKKEIKRIKDIFYKKNNYIPLDCIFMLYKKQIDKEKYISCRRKLNDIIKDYPYIVEALGSKYFDDTILARTALKRGKNMEFLPQYQNDDRMVNYALGKDGIALEYVNKRFHKDRDMVIRAIRNSGDDTIMYCDCMKPYRKDKELVYMACEVEPWNFTSVAKEFQDDYKLAKSVIIRNKEQSIFRYLSNRLKDDLSLALLDVEGDCPGVDTYSKRLKDNDEIAKNSLKYMVKTVGCCMI